MHFENQVPPSFCSGIRECWWCYSMRLQAQVSSSKMILQLAAGPIIRFLIFFFFIKRKRQLFCFDIISLCARVQADHASHTDNRRPVRLFPDSTSLLSPYTPGVNNRKLHFRESRTACTLVGDTCERGFE